MILADWNWLITAAALLLQGVVQGKNTHTSFAARYSLFHAAGLCFMTLSYADTPLAIDAATAKTSKQSTIDALLQASLSVLLLRSVELVLYRRTRSLLYQCRFKLGDGNWRRL